MIVQILKICKSKFVKIEDSRFDNRVSREANRDKILSTKKEALASIKNIPNLRPDFIMNNFSGM